MENKLESVFKAARKSEQTLKRLLNKYAKQAYKENEKNGVASFAYGRTRYATDDQYSQPIAVEENGHKIWLFNIWMNCNVVPDSVRDKMIDHRFPVKSVAMWYEPFHYGLGHKLSPDELYEQSEKEKVLYEDWDVKITMLRRNVIPFFHSYQYCHKVSQHEYVFYIKKYGKPYVGENGKRTRDIKLYECGHADNLKMLQIKMQRYINDWY